MRRHIPMVLLLFAAICVAAAPASAEVTDRVTRTIALAPGTPLAVHVTVGDVRITGWDRAEVALEVVRRAPDEERLARIPVDVQHDAKGVVIRATQAGDGRDETLRTDVSLRVPVSANLRDVTVFEGRLSLIGLREASTARVERGAITGVRLAGRIRLETELGDITLEDATLSPAGAMRLRTFNGDVILGLASRPADARILALSMGGTIASDIPLNRREAWGPRFAEATLGKGEPVIAIDVVNGDVAIRVPDAAR